MYQRGLNLLYPEVCPFCGEILQVSGKIGAFPEKRKIGNGPESGEQRVVKQWKKMDDSCICQECRKKLQYVEEPRCYRCGKPLREEDEDVEYCRDCAGRKRYFDQGRSLYLHRSPASDAIYRFKFKNQRVYAKVFAEEMAERFAKDLRRWQAEALIPIPLSEKRQKKRGYNQAKIQARELSKRTGIPVEEGALFRIRNTRPQKELDDRERQQNLRQAFAVAKCWKPVRSVVLVDDIYTTGSTINKAAKMLKKAGVSKVYFLTISIGQGL